MIVLSSPPEAGLGEYARPFHSDKTGISATPFCKSVVSDILFAVSISVLFSK
jgi:hypothetical protein